VAVGVQIYYLWGGMFLLHVAGDVCPLYPTHVSLRSGRFAPSLAVAWQRGESSLATLHSTRNDVILYHYGKSLEIYLRQ